MSFLLSSLFHSKFHTWAMVGSPQRTKNLFKNGRKKFKKKHELGWDLHRGLAFSPPSSCWHLSLVLILPRLAKPEVWWKGLKSTKNTKSTGKDWKILRNTENTEKYWKILENTEKYWKILNNTEKYWKILRYTENTEKYWKYWKILRNTEKYWEILSSSS